MTLHVNYRHDATASEHHALMAQLVGQHDTAYAKRKRHSSGQPQELDSIKNVTRMLGMGARADALISGSAALSSPMAAAAACAARVAVERAPVALTGRYCKESRSLPQSPWLIDGSRKAAGSVAECMTEVLVGAYGATEGVFHSAGREDVDVRMLGTGRPFMIELLCARTPYHSPEAIEAMAAKINQCGIVRVDGLRECDHAAMGEMMKQGEEAHRKDYRCVVHLSRRVTAADLALLNGTTELVCQQLTPLRVLHRRTLMTRERTVHRMAAVRLSPRFLQLDLTTQAGTYVKEFVHGDLGRTVPNVGSLLGCEADIMQLDVTGLHEK